MKVTLWGTRGSLPAAGPDTVQHGGNTACVEVRGDTGSLVVLDAGTGIRRLGATLGPEVRRVDVIITHFHMDHIQGLGFFAPLYRPDTEVHIWGPPSTAFDVRSRLARYLSPPLFPVRIRDLPCRLEVHETPRGRFEVDGLGIVADLVCHPGPTAGYRITEGSVSLAYLPDHEPALGARRFPEHPAWTSGFTLAAGADLLIHDAQYGDEEYRAHVGWGHSAISHTLAFATMVGARRLVTFHHDPAHDDAAVDAITRDAVRTADCPLDVIPGMEGATFTLDG